jgi:mannose-6-phosphate isomerase-like protein (cupin superfamily)
VKYIRPAIWLLSLCLSGLLLFASPAVAQGQYTVKPVAEKKVKQLPEGPLFWRIENFPTLAQAQAAAGAEAWNPDTVSYQPSTALAAEVAGKVWLFTLGPKGGSTPGASKVTEVGPVPPIKAAEYLLRINHGYGPPSAKTAVHTHPGSEAFYVVEGRLGQRTAHGTSHVEAGQFLNGHSADMPMEISNSGTTELTALVMFVVDASRPFSVPAKFE